MQSIHAVTEGAMCAVASAFWLPKWATLLKVGYVSSLATKLSDTFASEVGKVKYPPLVLSVGFEPRVSVVSDSPCRKYRRISVDAFAKTHASVELFDGIRRRACWRVRVGVRENCARL